ncbi:MAG: TonB-dependent receptor [Acidobacteria bacterium]|nr:TonB-dependent receptor [Acidobacteriota bacterium]
MRGHTSRLFLFALCLSLTVAISANAQRIDGDLRGEVKDPTEAVVPGAKVTLTSEATGMTREAKTTEVGVFFFANLLPGKYTFTVEMPGFRKVVRRGVEVFANRISEVIVTLELGAAGEIVEVTAGAELVQTTSSVLVGATFKEELTGVLANAGSLTGSPLNLAVVAPNTTTQPGGVAGTGGAIGGNRPRQNNFIVDGLDNNDVSVTGPITSVIADSVEEFTLLTNQFTAEYGHSTAGQFIVTTRSGTNELHGRAWWYNQNRDRNSLDHLTRAVTPPGEKKPRYDWNRFGGQFGGPIMKDKWFAFGAYEYRDLNLAATPGAVIFVPTQGGMSTLQSLAANPASGVSPNIVEIFSSYVPTAATQTATTSVCDESLPPLGPESLCYPFAAPVTIGLGQFSASTPNFDREHIFLVTSDVVTARFRHSTRFQYSRERAPSAGDLPVPAFNSSIMFDTRRATYSNVFAVNPSVVNEFRVGYLWTRADYPVPPLTAPAGTDVFANYELNDMSLFIGPSSNFPQSGGDSNWNIVDQISWIRGAHAFKAGADVRVLISFSDFLPRARGEYLYVPVAGVSESDLDAFVRDTFPVGVALRGVGNGFFAQDRTAFYWFIQDTWKVSRRLTLDLGLRYEFTEPARDSAFQDLNAIANVSSFSSDPVFASLNPIHQNLLRTYLNDQLIFRKPRSDKNNWAPRVGFAWDIFGDGKTALRGGASIGYDVIFGNLPLLQLPPQLQSEIDETGACAVSPPSWCAQPLSTIRYSNIGFLEAGAFPPVLPPFPAGAAGQALARLFTGGYVYDDRMPETYTWSLALQRELFKDWSVEARYVGTHAINLPMQVRFNAGIPIVGRLPVFMTQTAASATDFTGQPTLASLLAQTGPVCGFDRCGLLDPFGFGGAVTAFAPVGRSSYHGGSVKVERRFAQGLLLKSSYTWSKTIDVGENELFTSFLNPRRPKEHFDLEANRGLSALQRQHKFVISWVYDLPSYKGDNVGLRRLLEGWQVSGSYIAESGQPVSILSLRDVNGDFDTAGDGVYFNPAGTLNTGTDSTTVCWDGSAVSFGCSLSSQIVGYVANDANAQYVRGRLLMETNLGRNTFISPGINNWNLEFSKRTQFWPGREERVLLFTAQLINAFNHPSPIVGNGSVFGTYAAATTNTGYVTPGAPSFLQETSFSGGLGNAPFQRLIQFGLKLIF